MTTLGDIKAKITVDVEGGKIEGLDGFGNVYVISLPSTYLSANSAPENRQVGEYYQKALLQIINSKREESVGLILPSDTQSDGSKLFDIKVYSKAPPVYITSNSHTDIRED